MIIYFSKQYAESLQIFNFKTALFVFVKVFIKDYTLMRNLALRLQLYVFLKSLLVLQAFHKRKQKESNIFSYNHKRICKIYS